jgi:hypothetical protein
VDRQLLPLATQIEDLQNVIEDLVKTQLRCWTAATGREMRQDKLFKLRRLQLRQKRLPPLSFRHSDPPKSPALPDSVASAETPRTKAAYSQIQPPSKTRNQLAAKNLRRRIGASEKYAAARTFAPLTGAPFNALKKRNEK